MADKVQQQLEGMVPELENLIHNGIFSQEEIKCVVEKRRDFEYRLVKAARKKRDYLEYIQYEINLDQLVRQRADRLGVLEKKLGRYRVKHILMLLRGAVYRWKTDTSLWLQYLEFQMLNGHKAATALSFAEALSIHSVCPALWLLASNWEYAENFNIATARALLQRGIRINPLSPVLYLEYARLELMYLQKVKQREEFFGTKTSDKTEEEKEEKEDGVEEKVEINVDSLPDVEKKDDKDDIADSNQDAFMSGAVAKIIFGSAVKALPGNFDMCEKFVGIFRLFPEVPDLVSHVYEYIIANFKDAAALSFLALRSYHQYSWERQRQLQKKATEDKEKISSSSSETSYEESEEEWHEQDVDMVFQVEYLSATRDTLSSYKSYILTAPPKTSEALIPLFLQFGREQYKLWSTPMNENRELITLLSQEAKQILTKFKDTKAKVSPVCIISLAAFFLETKESESALQVLEMGTDTHPYNSLLWAQRLSLLELFATQESVDTSTLVGLYHQATTLAHQFLKNEELKLLTGELEVKEETEQSAQEQAKANSHFLLLHFQYLKLLATSGMEFKLFMKTYKLAINARVGLDAAASFKENILELAIAHFNSAQIEEFCNYSLQLPPVTKSFLHSVIRWEKNRTSPNLNNISKLYAVALEQYGATDHKFWLDNIAWEQEQKNYKAANSLYWQAVKSLTAPELFIQEHHKLVNHQDTTTV